MRKDLGIKQAIFPMPVLMIATYNEDGSVDCMNAAWGMMGSMNTVALNLTESHKTVKNIKQRKAFTVSIADSAHVAESDYLGIVSGNNVKDKFERSGLTAIKSNFVDAPIIEDYPITMECEFIEYQDEEHGCGVIGKIVNVSADESVLDENGNIIIEKLNAIMYDPFNYGYYKVGEKVGQAFSDGNKLK
jgi:flavin reductase (DIM6/NTAB) family NADH-FMN oxidoreductase RutF